MHKIRWWSMYFNPFEGHWARYKSLCGGYVTWDEAIILLANELEHNVRWREPGLNTIMELHRTCYKTQPVLRETYVMRWEGDEMVLEASVYDLAQPTREDDDGK